MSIKNKIKNFQSNHPFASFLSRKLAFMLLVLFAAYTLIFILPRLMPSDPAQLMIARLAMGQGNVTSIGVSEGGGGGATGVETQLANLKQVYAQKFGLGKSLLDQYILHWKHLFTMEWGISYWKYPKTVSEVVAYSLPWTLALILPIPPLGFLIGNWIGSRAAFKRGKIDEALYTVAQYLQKFPYYWLGMILILIFGVKLGWFPLFGAYSQDFSRPFMSFDFFISALHHYALPFLSLVGLGIGGWAVGMRAMTIYEMESDYMVYAKQLGFSSEKRRKMAERNAILPNFTFLNNTLAGLIGQTLIVEVVFGYPGLGTVFYNAVFQQDYPLITCGFTVTILIVIVGNYMIDILYGVLDPRIGSGYVEER